MRLWPSEECVFERMCYERMEMKRQTPELGVVLAIALRTVVFGPIVLMLAWLYDRGRANAVSDQLAKLNKAFGR